MPVVISQRPNGGVQTDPGLDTGFFVSRNHEIILAQRLAFPKSLIEIQDSLSFGLKVGSRGKIQLRCAAPQPKEAMRVEFEYERGGALAYLAAWDVRRAKVTPCAGPSLGATS